MNDYREATALTEALVDSMPTDAPLDKFWESPQAAQALEQLRTAGFQPEEFLYDAPADLGMNPGQYLKRYFRSYARQIRGALCGQNQDLRNNVNVAIQAGAASLLATLAAALAIAPAAVVLLTPIAAIILMRGVDAFCHMDDEPAPAGQ